MLSFRAKELRKQIWQGFWCLRWYPCFTIDVCLLLPDRTSVAWCSHLEMSEERDSWRDLSHVLRRRRWTCGGSLSSEGVSRSHRLRDLHNEQLSTFHPNRVRVINSKVNIFEFHEQNMGCICLLRKKHGNNNHHHQHHQRCHHSYTSLLTSDVAYKNKNNTFIVTSAQIHHG